VNMVSGPLVVGCLVSISMRCSSLRSDGLVSGE
jgi:hypothetical protein